MREPASRGGTSPGLTGPDNWRWASIFDGRKEVTCELNTLRLMRQLHCDEGGSKEMGKEASVSTALAPEPVFTSIQ